MRKPFIAGNWKMNNTIDESVELARGIMDFSESGKSSGCDIAVIPSFLSIPEVAALLKTSDIDVGAQDIYFKEKGAFTGEISTSMIRDAGCCFALVGHSERRHVLGESDELVNQKLKALINDDLGVVLCVGETLQEREAGETQSRVKAQIEKGLHLVNTKDMQKVTIAYEPVWAIGTGKTATTDQAQDVHVFIRELLWTMFDDETAQSCRIQYGGSVKPSNAAQLISMPDIDGALVGGASLDVSSFVGIISETVKMKKLKKK